MNPRRMQGGAGVRSRRSVPKAQNVKAQGNALGTCETNDQSPQRGEMLLHFHHALSGLRRSILAFPGAMPQAFTLCRVAAAHTLRDWYVLSAKILFAAFRLQCQFNPERNGNRLRSDWRHTTYAQTCPVPCVAKSGKKKRKNAP